MKCLQCKQFGHEQVEMTHHTSNLPEGVGFAQRDVSYFECPKCGALEEDREPMEHEVKIWPEYFMPLVELKKRAEFRYNDRDYREGDTLKLREWSPLTKTYTGRSAKAVITHVDTGGAIPESYALLSLSPPPR